MTSSAARCPNYASRSRNLAFLIRHNIFCHLLCLIVRKILPSLHSIVIAVWTDAFDDIEVIWMTFNWWHTVSHAAMMTMFWSSIDIRTITFIFNDTWPWSSTLLIAYLPQISDWAYLCQGATIAKFLYLCTTHLRRLFRGIDRDSAHAWLNGCERVVVPGLLLIAWFVYMRGPLERECRFLSEVNEPRYRWHQTLIIYK